MTILYTTLGILFGFIAGAWLQKEKADVFFYGLVVPALSALTMFCFKWVLG